MKRVDRRTFFMIAAVILFAGAFWMMRISPRTAQPVSPPQTVAHDEAVGAAILPQQQDFENMVRGLMFA